MGRIRIGGQTSFAAASITAPFEYAIAHGFDAFEWFPDTRPTGQGWQETDLQPDARVLIRQAAREHDIALSVHGSWDASLLTPEGCRCLAGQARFAADIAAAIFVIHLDGNTDLARYVEATTPLAAQLASDGIGLAIENTPTAAPDDFNELFRLMRDRRGRSQRNGFRSVPRQDSGDSAPGPDMCLDVGHANLYAGTRNNYLAYIDSLGEDVPISHVHLHENWGDTDSHLPLFTGPAGHDDSGVASLVDRLVGRRQLIDRFRINAVDLVLRQPARLLDERAKLAAQRAARHVGPPEGVLDHRVVGASDFKRSLAGAYVQAGLTNQIAFQNQFPNQL